MQLSASSNMLKQLVDGTIEMKYEELTQLDFEDMTEEENEEYDKACSKYKELHNKVKEILTDEQFRVVSESWDALVETSCLEQRYMFHHGVKAGLRELSFIKEILGMGVIML